MKAQLSRHATRLLALVRRVLGAFRVDAKLRRCVRREHATFKANAKAGVVLASAVREERPVRSGLSFARVIAKPLRV
jgi:hypothetical protein